MTSATGRGLVLALLPVLATLAACAERPGTRAPVNLTYSCADGQSPVVRYHPDDRATIRLDDGRAIELASEPATSGERYGADGITFWRKAGKDATLEVGGRSTDCTRTG